MSKIVYPSWIKTDLFQTYDEHLFFVGKNFERSVNSVSVMLLLCFWRVNNFSKYLLSNTSIYRVQLQEKEL